MQVQPRQKLIDILQVVVVVILVCFVVLMTECMMHSVSSTECDQSVRAWATNLEDFDMLGKLADLFAQDTVYHKECMTKYYTCLSKIS